jgi:flavin reductase (DIM6/NTAB) family NADH-FMN oxidoreductase RutF
MIKKLDTTDFENMEQRYRAAFFNSLGGFKSVNLVGTTDNAGQTNLSIVNSVFHIGANPPFYGMVIRPHTVPRHTLENILETKEYTLNHITADFYKKAHQTSARYPKETSEFDACGLTPEFIDGCRSPFVKESAVKIGLDFVETKEIELNGTVIVIGQIKMVMLDDDLVANDGFVDLESAASITCAGLDAYYSVKKLARLSYAKEDIPPKEI